MSSGYLNEDDVPSAFDGKADNVDADFNPIDSYYNGDKGIIRNTSYSLNSPEPQRNLTTNQGYKSFTVSWNNILKQEILIYIIEKLEIAIKTG